MLHVPVDIFKYTPTVIFSSIRLRFDCRILFYCFIAVVRLKSSEPRVRGLKTHSTFFLLYILKSINEKIKNWRKKN